MNVIFILVIAFTESSSKEWIDPYDMNINSKTNPKSSENSLNSDRYSSNYSEDISLLYLKRFVNLIINSATPDDINSHQRIGKFVLNSENEDFQFLIDFSKKQNINSDDLRKLDSIISGSFQKGLSDNMFESLFSANSFISNLPGFRNIIVIVGIILGLYITFHLLKSQFGFLYIIKYFILIILIIDYGFRYQTLLEEAESHNMKLEYSALCDTSKMTWREWSKFLLSNQKCEKIFVTPLEVALVQIKQLIIIPLSAVGTGMGSFATELWQNIHSPWKFLIFPIMLLFVVLIYGITMLGINNYPIKIKLLHLINFEFGHQVDSSNHLSGATLDKLLDVVKHRPMIEEEEAGNRKEISEKSRKSSQKNEKKQSGAIAYKKVKEKSLPEKCKIVEDGNPETSIDHSKKDVISEVPNVNSMIESTES